MRTAPQASGHSTEGVSAPGKFRRIIWDCDGKHERRLVGQSFPASFCDYAALQLEPPRYTDRRPSPSAPFRQYNRSRLCRAHEDYLKSPKPISPFSAPQTGPSGGWRIRLRRAIPSPLLRPTISSLNPPRSAKRPSQCRIPTQRYPLHLLQLQPPFSCSSRSRKPRRMAASLRNPLAPLLRSQPRPTFPRG